MLNKPSIHDFAHTYYFRTPIQDEEVLKQAFNRFTQSTRINQKSSLGVQWTIFNTFATRRDALELLTHLQIPAVTSNGLTTACARYLDEHGVFQVVENDEIKDVDWVKQVERFKLRQMSDLLHGREFQCD
jgi:hypothetical protein